MTLILGGRYNDLELSEAQVATLTRPQREVRVDRLVSYSFALVDEAFKQHFQNHLLAATCVLFSGGNDSTLLAHLFKGAATHAVHANTTIGVEATRQYVRDTCASWGLPLIEPVAPTSYDALVIDRGFPGPGHHFKMYQRLKERGLRAARKQLVSNPRKQRVIFLAGRRRTESARRSNVVEMERLGSTVWVSPLVAWTKADMTTYRLMRGDVPVNTVAELLGMSGECLCGAFAEPGEFDRIKVHYPDTAAEITALEVRAVASGLPAEKCQWGWGAYRVGKIKSTPKTGPLCSSCDARYEQRTFDDMSPELAAVIARRAARKRETGSAA